MTALPERDELLTRLRAFQTDYVIEDGEIHVFDAQTGRFVPAGASSHAGTGPYPTYVEHDGQVLCD